MGLNNYKFWIKEKIDQFTTLINGRRASKAERELKADTEKLPITMSPMPGARGQEIARMEVEIGEAHFLTMMARDLSRQHDRPMKALDIGTFTGHSAGAIAKGMANGGTVITCDIEGANARAYEPIAEKYWKAEGIRDRIDYRITPDGAKSVLEGLTASPAERGTYDMVFIDADKPGYEAYYEAAKKLLRPGGKIVLDNMLWSGRVTNPNMRDKNTTALRDLNRKISTDNEVDSVLLNADDGLMVVEKLGWEGRLKRDKETSQAQWVAH